MSLPAKEYIQIKRYHSDHVSKKDIEEIIQSCSLLFNAEFGDNFLNAKNLKMEFFSIENGVSVYEQFCKQHFPSYLTGTHSKNYTEVGYMESFAAQAFVDGDVYGILVSLDADIEPNEWYNIILHEMSHIFCITHEISGDGFFRKYCEKRDLEGDRFTGAGYAVWREYVADYMTAGVAPFSNSLSIVQIREKIRQWDEYVDVANPAVEMLVSQILAYIFRNLKVRQAKNAETAYDFLEKNRVFASKARARYYYQLIEIIFEQISKDDYWEITLDFIRDLGATYSLMLARRHTEFCGM